MAVARANPENSMSRRLLVTLLSVFAYPAPGLADEPWRFSLTPYLWFAGLQGDVATVPGAPAAPIDISPRDAVDDTEAAIMFTLDAKRGHHGIYTDIFYSDVRSEDPLLPPPIGLSLHSTTKTTAITVAYEYEFYRQQAAFADVLIGARYWKLDSELSFGGGLGFLAGRKVSHDESWVDPVIGLKGLTPLGDSRFYLQGGFGIGGFGVGSDSLYEWNAAVGYQWTKSIGTAVGYRMFVVDYADGGFVYDVKQAGWLAGLTWTF